MTELRRLPVGQVEEELARAAAEGAGVGVLDVDGRLAQRLAAAPRAVRYRAADPVQHHGANPFARPLAAHYGLAVRHVTILHAGYLGPLPLAKRRALRMLCAALLAYPGASVMDLWRLPADALFRRQVAARLGEGAVRRWWRRFEEAPPAEREGFFEPLLDRLSDLLHTPGLYATLTHRRSFNFRALLERRRPFAADLSGLPERERRYLAGLLAWRFWLAALVHAGAGPYRLYLPEEALAAAGLGRATGLAHRQRLEFVLHEDARPD